MPTRAATIAALLVSAALSATTSSTASAQTFALAPTTSGRAVAAPFATTTHDVLASAAVGAPTEAASETSFGSENVDLVSESIPASRWEMVDLHSSSSNEDESGEPSAATSFFGSTVGRTSLAGIAGLAGASFFALRSTAPSPVASNVSSGLISATPATTASGGLIFSLPNTPGVVVTPEPATLALLAFGFAGLATVARRRRTS